MQLIYRSGERHKVSELRLKSCTDNIETLSIRPLLTYIHTKKLSCLKYVVEFDMNDILYEFKNLPHF